MSSVPGLLPPDPRVEEPYRVTPQTAIRIAVMRELRDATHPALQGLVDALAALSARTWRVVKAGRTHLMDATPVTIGQEADAWSGLLARALSGSASDLAALGELPLGGTAVGTGINAPAGFAASANERVDASYGTASMLRLVRACERLADAAGPNLDGMVLVGGGAWQDLRAGALVVHAGRAAP